jgi:hypothetical protein
MTEKTEPSELLLNPDFDGKAAWSTADGRPCEIINGRLYVMPPDPCDGITIMDPVLKVDGDRVVFSYRPSTLDADLKGLTLRALQVALWADEQVSATLAEWQSEESDNG